MRGGVGVKLNEFANDGAPMDSDEEDIFAWLVGYKAM